MSSISKFIRMLFVPALIIFSVITTDARPAFALRFPHVSDANNLYSTLGVSPKATDEELIKSLHIKLKDKTLPQDVRTKLAVTTSFLLNPSFRKQYDAGETAEVEIPPEKREEYAQYLESVSKEKASRLRKLGKISLDNIASIVTFYVGTGILAYVDCFRTQDPLICKSWNDSLTSVEGLAGMGVFMGSAHVTSKLLSGIAQKSSLHAMGAGFAGLGVGSVAASLFGDLANMPETKQLMRLNKDIADPEKRNQKRQELLHAIYAKTVVDPKWWSERVPEVTSMILASTASTATAGIYSAAKTKITEKRAARASQRKSIQPTTSGTISAATTEIMTEEKDTCGLGFLKNVVIGGPSKLGFKSFMKGQGHELANLLLFLQYDRLIHPHVDDAWDKLTVGTKLERSREKLKQAQSDEAFRATLAENESLWNRARMHKMKPLEQSMGLHAAEIASFDTEMTKAHAYYTWLLAGASDKDQNWENLRDTFYDKDTKASDANVKKDADHYLRQFFFGTDPETSFTDSKDHHGIPDPRYYTAKFEPYRVATDVPKTQVDESYDQLLKRLKDHKDDYIDAESDAFSAVQAKANLARNQRIGDFENQTQKKLLDVLIEDKGSTITQSIQTQLDDLNELATKATNADQKKAVVEKIYQIKEEQNAVKTLVDYYRTPQKQRTAPESTLDNIINSLDPNNPAEWIKAVKYYKSYIFQ